MKSLNYFPVLFSFLAAAIGGALAIPTNVSASDEAAVHDRTAVSQRVRDELRVVMAELVESGAFGDQPQQGLAFTVDTPAQQVNDLGLLVTEAGHDKRGVRVLAVTPGSNAERMGLHAGDELLALNDVDLGDGSTSLRRALDGLPNGSRLSLRVRRDGQVREFSGTSSSIYLPAMRLIVGDAPQVAASETTARSEASATPAATQSCGRISDLDVAPRQQNLHGATIITIDGNLPGASGSHSYRVAPGPHVLQVSERIENRYLTFNDRLRNSSNRYKTLKVDVQPGVTTLIAARLDPDKSNVWQNGAYWEPVAWKQVDEPCR